MRDFFVLSVFVFLMPLDAYSYIDPGSGSFLLQTILAVGLGAAYLFKTKWSDLKIVVRGLLSSRKPTMPELRESSESEEKSNAGR